MAKEEIVQKTFAEQLAENKKKKSKIVSGCIFGIIFALVTIIVVLACVPYSNRPTNLPNPSSIRFNTTSHSREYGINEDEYKDFIEIYNQAFETNYLKGMFSGRLSGYKIDHENSNGSWITSIPSDVTSGNYVVFDYWDEAPYLLDNNGKIVMSKKDSTQSVKIKTITFAVNDQESDQTIDMYIAYDLVIGSSTQSYYVKISAKANTYKMNEFITELF